VSTPHDQHWRNIQQAGNYDFLFVDKPIVINKSEYEEYISSSQKIIALMNRRFSEYTNVVKEFIEQDDQKCSLELSFSVQKKSPQDRIFFTGGRIIGEMCHHIDLCIFLNGPVKNVEFIAFDADKKRQKIEDCKFFLVHNNGNISSISYNQGTTPYWQKENLLVQKGDQYIVVKDFSKLITNSQKLKNISFKEKDKGCFNMWKTIVSRLGTQNQCFADFIALDKQVYNILFKVF
jgi:polar amino acid transport system substrate-binding protein